MADIWGDIKITFKGRHSKTSRNGDLDEFGRILLSVISGHFGCFGGDDILLAAVEDIVSSFLNYDSGVCSDAKECQKHLESFLKAYKEREARLK